MSLTTGYRSAAQGRHALRSVTGFRLVCVVSGFIFLSLGSYRFRKGTCPKGDPEMKSKKISVSGEAPEIFLSQYPRFECKSCPNAEELMDARAPLAIIGGVMKGGTRTILTYLSQHPEVYSEQGNEIHVLDNRMNEIHNIDGREDQVTTIERCEVLKAYQQIFKEKLSIQKEQEDRDDQQGFQKYFFDKSPTYLTNSHVAPQRALCMFPNAKVIFVLRDPTSRSYSHYQHLFTGRSKQGSSLATTFETFIDREMEILKQTGVLDAETPQEEYDAWVKYISHREFQLGRGLYAIQLRQWIKVFIDHFGEDDWQNHLLILDSNRMHADKQATYNEVLDFLGLARHTLADIGDFHVGSYEPMANATRDRLETFFRPHNQKLHELLSPYGIDISWAHK